VRWFSYKWNLHIGGMSGWSTQGVHGGRQPAVFHTIQVLRIPYWNEEKNRGDNLASKEVVTTQQFHTSTSKADSKNHYSLL
jgi:hypothetical protein